LHAAHRNARGLDAAALTGLAAGALAGLAIVELGSRATDRAPYYVAVFGSLAVAAVIAFTRREPLRFVFLTLVAGFPLASALVPPGKLGLTAFELASLLLALGILWVKLVAQQRIVIFPTGSLCASWVLLLVCVAFSQDVLVSLRATISLVALHAFFLSAYAELRRGSGFERLVVLLCVATLIVGVGLFIDHWTHLNLSMRGSNLNQQTYVGGLEIWRAGGFFQDPQRAGAYLAAVVSFLLVLAVRKRFPTGPTGWLVWATVVIGAAGLSLTISRGAIAAFVGVSSVVLLMFNRWRATTKIALVTCLALAGFAVALLPVRSWDRVLPAALTGRFEHTAEELDIRQSIWLDTADMFADHPLVGVGPGAFRPYLIATRPGRTGYYGIGAGTDPDYVPDQPESGYLKVVYEGGIAGALALLLLVGDVLRRALAALRAPDPSPEVRTELIAALGGLATLAATFVTLFTVSDPRVAAVFALLCAFVLNRSSRPITAARQPDGP